LTKETIFAATKPAVSVRSLLSPKEMGINFLFKAFFISSKEKYP